jgi:hypothetical protein
MSSNFPYTFALFWVDLPMAEGLDPIRNKEVTNILRSRIRNLWIFEINWSGKYAFTETWYHQVLPIEKDPLAIYLLEHPEVVTDDPHIPVFVRTRHDYNA